MTDQEYFSLARISNSDLSKFHDFLFGNTKRIIPTEAFALGTEVHRLILEPKNPQNAEASQQAKEMADCFKVAFGTLKRYDMHEHVVLWEAENGLPLKSKLDLYNDKSIITAVADIKTTSATSFEQFMEQDFDRFNYAQQAAFYMDSVQAHTYELFCVSKIFPYETWKIELWADSKPVVKARKRYKTLLNEWPKHNFIPDTWNQ